MVGERGRLDSVHCSSHFSSILLSESRAGRRARLGGRKKVESQDNNPRGPGVCQTLSHLTSHPQSDTTRGCHAASTIRAIFLRFFQGPDGGRAWTREKRWRVKKTSLLFLKISRMASRYINHAGQNHLRIRANTNLCVSFIYNTRGPAETANRDGTAFAHSGREPGGRRTPSAMRGGL